MSIVMQPAAYLIGTVTGTLTLRPASFVFAIPNGRMVLQPAMFVTCIEEAPKTKVKADTRRNLPARIEADTKRTLLTKVEVGTDRKVITPVAKLALDTARTLVNDRIHDVALAVDTRRDIDIVHVDFDVARSLIQNVKAAYDTHRRVAVPTTVTCRTRRVLQNRVAIAADTKRCIPYRLPAPDANHPLEPFRKLGIRSVSFTLGELTLSDTFQLETVQPLTIGDAVDGQLLDYHFHFLVEETSQRDLVQSVKGMYDCDALLYTPIYICVDEALVSYYVQEIAAAMDWNIDMNCDDFIPSQNYENSGMTYQDFISSLFGWTSRLPHRQINVFCAAIRCTSSSAGRSRASSISRIGRTAVRRSSGGSCAPSGAAATTTIRTTAHTTKPRMSPCRSRGRFLSKTSRAITSTAISWTRRRRMAIRTMRM